MATAIHQYEDKLLDFAYGELPAPEASAVESHLKSCTRCTQALDQIRGVRTTMSALPQEPAPVAGLDSLLAYAEQAAARNAAAPRAVLPWWRRIVAPVAGACALTLVAVVAIKTQDDGLDLSAETAALQAKPPAVDSLDRRAPPAPVAAAPILAPNEEAGAPSEPELQKVVEKVKAGKAAGAMRGAESDRKAKEDRGWDAPANQKDSLAKNNNDGYTQELGATKGPGESRQRAQREDLGTAVAAAQKESKSRREAPSAGADQDYGNARGAYVQSKKAEEKKGEDSAKKKSALSDSTTANKGDSAPEKITSAVKPASAPPPAAAPKPAPVLAAPAQVASEADEKQEKELPAQRQGSQQAPSLGLSMPSTGSGSTGSGSTGGLGTRSTSPSGYKQQAPSRDSSDDEAAGRGTNDMAERKRLSKDADNEQRDQELAARGYIDAARSASNRGNRQEEVKQSLAVLQTNVKGASRAEALNRLCSALTDLGNEGQADKYCDALIKEFPNSAAAKVVANRRSNQRRAAPSSKSASPSYDSESAADKAEPAKAKPADDSKPAMSH